MRPSNSGTATPDATSSGPSPASSASHAWREASVDGDWITGMPSSSRPGTDQPSPSAFVVPAASVDVMITSTPWSRHSSSASTRPAASARSEYVAIASTSAPAASSAAARSRSDAVFPATRWAR